MVKITKNNLEFTRGDTCLLYLELVDENLEPVDLSGCTGKLSVKEYLNDTTAKQKITLPFYNHPDADPAGGKVYFKIAPSDTVNLQFKKYYYDIQILRGVDVYTVRKGDLILESEVSFNV